MYSEDCGLKGQGSLSFIIMHECVGQIHVAAELFN